MAATKAKRNRSTKEGERFKKNVKAAIDRLGITQTAAAKRVGYQPTQIYQILAELSNPNTATMVRMATMVEIPLHLLLGPGLPADSEIPLFQPLPTYDWAKLPEEGERFLRNVRRRIKRLGMTGEAAGQTVGYKPGQMSQLLKRTTNPTMFTMVRMARMTDVSVVELLDPAFDPWGPTNG